MILKLLISPLIFFLISLSGPETDWNPDNKNIPYSPADYKTPVFKISGSLYTDKEIPKTSSSRVHSHLGAIIPVGKTRNFQLNFGASFLNQSDIENSFDVTGWDGVILTDISYKLTDNFGLRFGSKHISGHLGDEFIKKTGWERVSKSRNENLISVWYELYQHTSFIAETGFDSEYDREDHHKYKASPWRHQLALFHLNKDIKNTWIPYWATDFQFHQEDDFDPCTSFQYGFSFTDGKNNTFRIGAEYYRGKVNMIEFSGFKEEYIGLAFWIDF